MDSLLSQLGINIASSLVYDILKGCAKKIAHPTFEDYKKELLPHLSINNAEITAKALIDFAAQNGDIVISGSTIFSDHSISFGSSAKGGFEIKNGSSTSTKKTLMHIGIGASISGRGGAKIEQKDGIKFFT